ncbi:restriction endonuclease subunit S [Morganella morganii]|uniref:restriction endonuclease subunit S n=1 Tax=Morganella morganii TaxID=582 RepID=UPI0032DB06B6
MLPEGWEIIHLGDCLSMLRSGLSRNLSSEDIGVPVIRSGNMTDEYINFEELKYWHIDDPQGSDTSNYILDDGDLLISFINSQAQIGKTSIFFNKINRPCIYTTNILRAKPSANLDLRYFFYVTKTKDYDDYIQSITKPAVNQASFTTKDFQKYKFQLPPLPEQKKIARILSTWDNAISATVRLLENSQQRKKALMQQLLTGKKRLPGFEGGWEEQVLSVLCSIKTGKKDVNEGNPDGIYPFFTCANEPTWSDSYSYDCEALLIAGNGMLGRTHYYNGKFEAYQRTYILSDFQGVDVSFLHQYILFWLMRDIEREKQHGAMPYIKLGLLQNFRVFKPDLKEQQAIANVLTTADQEIDALQKRLGHLKLEKKALMQQLLTGKRRVLVDTAA